MPSVENQFHIRPYLPEKNLADLAALLTKVESFDRDGEDTPEEALRQALEWPNFRPTQDAWVAEYEGNLAGYAVALEQPSHRCIIYVVVQPASRREGLGSQLLALTLDRAREFGAKTTLIYANEHNQASKSFLDKQGFILVGGSGAMKAPAGASAPAVEFPAGFTLQRFSEVNDLLTLACALNDCYQGMWGHQHSEKPSANNPNVARFLEHYGANNILLLLDAQKLVSGICSVKPAETKADDGDLIDILDAPGVIHKYRGHGYQRQLVSAGVQHLREQAHHAIKLEFWGEDPETLSSYSALGFEMLQQYLAYHKDVL